MHSIVNVATFMIIFTVLFEVECASLPKEFTKCHKKDPKFMDCLTKSVKDAIRSLKDGNAALKIPSIDPTYVKSANIGRGTGPVDVAQNYTDINLYGISSFADLKISKLNLDKFYVEVEAFSPYLSWIANYRLSGRILLLPIFGEGAVNITLTNVKSKHTIKGETFKKKDNKTYVKCTTFDIKLDPERVWFNFENLFNGNKELGDNMNNVLNDNNKEIYADIRSGYEDILSQVYPGYCNAVFKKVPFDEIFVD